MLLTIIFEHLIHCLLGWRSHYWWRHLWYCAWKFAHYPQHYAASKSSWYNYLHCNQGIVWFDGKIFNLITWPNYILLGLTPTLSSLILPSSPPPSPSSTITTANRHWSWIWRRKVKIHHDADMACSYPAARCRKTRSRLSPPHWSARPWRSLPVRNTIKLIYCSSAHLNVYNLLFFTLKTVVYKAVPLLYQALLAAARLSFLRLFPNTQTRTLLFMLDVVNVVTKWLRSWWISPR